ncbi:MAG: hypothetical protein GFH27_549321n29 [Chloroflexi bacterium AL-W]|nr:hypothetical protein [Chloroflexi bacterium AL-N1]NOK64907.1 hypothetical protein [Chloroflexi bacterium AL-N10]NOK76677.1 hypothetical protein [Chloroflexi bacterium AL-N5]NOK84568.1 hypothetical protein [Chloroflexi bacterium AL-W]NOK86607.1 hypothetical protein [Chloroflexi bacterium AL-N15]
MPDLRTNRDLYLAIETLTHDHRFDGRSLEHYLLALLRAAEPFADAEALSLNDFYHLIVQSFVIEPHEFDEGWCQQYDQLPYKEVGFSGWRATVIRQIVDLREMAENRILANKYRHFGVDSPRRSRWYNFDPVGYLECAMAGSFGGWEPGATSGREFVPGTVALLADDGSIQGANPEDIPRPQFEIPYVSWEECKGFIICGQVYE